MLRRSSAQITQLLKFSTTWSCPLLQKPLPFSSEDQPVDPRSVCLFSSELHPKVVDRKSKGSPKLDLELRHWLWNELTQAPNLVSLSRLISGPFIGALIIQESWLIASVSLSFAAVSQNLKLDLI